MGQHREHVLVRPGADPSLRGSLLDPHLHRAGPGPGRHQNLSQWSASPAGGGGSVLHSHWSSDAQPSLVESFRVMLLPVIICHKEPAQTSHWCVFCLLLAGSLCHMAGSCMHRKVLILVPLCHREPARSKQNTPKK